MYSLVVLVTSFYLSHLFEDTVFKHSHTLRCWGLGQGGTRNEMGRDRGCGSCQEVLTDFRWRTAWTGSLQGLRGVRGSAVTASSSPGRLPSRSPSITLRRWLGIFQGCPAPNQTLSRCPGACRALAVQPRWGLSGA